MSGQNTSQETYQFQAEINQLMSLIINAFYSNREIFLRELISNSSDALDKIKFESLQNKEIGDINNLEIKIKAEDGKLIIEDNGIGMTKEDLINCLGTIANSGTKKFIQSLTTEQRKDTSMIGQFGVGFYSAYLVADSVKVTTKHNDDSEYVWESNANGNYTITKSENDNATRGTKIELTLKTDANEFLDVDRIKDIIKKHSEYIQYPIKVYTKKIKEVIEEECEENISSEKDNFKCESENQTENVSSESHSEIQTKNENEEDIKIESESHSEGHTDEKIKDSPKKEKKVNKTFYEYDQVNNQEPIWTKPTSEVTKQEYLDFYKSISDDYAEPLIYKHFSVEGAVNFKSILYIPGYAPMNLFHMSRERNDVKLYVKKVLISDNCDKLIPNWLNFVKGIVDSDDIPLNVSREMLQQNKFMKLIKKSLIKKTIELLYELAEDKELYLRFFLSFGKNIKLGIHENTEYQDKLSKLLRFKTSKSENKFVSFDEYVGNIKKQFGTKIDEEIKLDDKYKNIYFIVGEDMSIIENSPFVEGFKQRGLEVIYMTEAIDEYMMKQFTTYEGFKFVNICNNDIDLSAYDKNDKEDLEIKFEKLINYLKQILDKKVSNIKISNRLVDAPCVLTTDNFGWSANMERIMKAQALGDTQMKQFMTSSKTLEINPNHVIIKEIQKRIENDSVDEIKDIIMLMFNGAMLSSGFSLDEPHEFVKTLNKMIIFGLNVETETDVEIEKEPESKVENEIEDLSKSMMDEVD